MSHKKQTETFNKIIQIIKELHSKFPNQNILRHISDAISDQTTIWGIEDKDLLSALEKYKEDIYFPTDDEVDSIIKDGRDLGKSQLIDDTEYFNPDSETW